MTSTRLRDCRYTHDPPLCMGTRYEGAKPNNQYLNPYPWARWFRRRKFTLVRGVDYTVRTSIMVQNIRNACKPSRHNLKVKIEVDRRYEKYINVEVSPRTEPQGG